MPGGATGGKLRQRAAQRGRIGHDRTAGRQVEGEGVHHGRVTRRNQCRLPTRNTAPASAAATSAPASIRRSSSAMAPSFASRRMSLRVRPGTQAWMRSSSEACWEGSTSGRSLGVRRSANVSSQ